MEERAKRPSLARAVAMVSALLLALVTRAQPPVLPDPKPVTPILYGGDSSFRVYEWLTASGRPIGFQVELIRAVGDVMNVPVQINLGNWDDIKTRFTSGELNVVAMFQNSARESFADFCDAHNVEYSQIFIRKGGPAFNSLTQLAGRHVIVQRGALAEDFMRAAKIEAEFIEVRSEEEALSRLSAGEGDAAVITESGGRMAMRAAGLADRLTTTGPPVLPSNVAFAVREGDAQTRALINEGLAKLRASGKFEEIYQRWFAETGEPVITLEAALRWAGIVGTPLTAIAVVGWFTAARQRRAALSKQKALDEELTQRKRTEEALRAADDRLKIAMSSSEILVAHQDMDLKYTWVSNSALDCDERAAIGQTDHNIFPGTVADRLTELKRRCITTGEPFREILALPRERDSRWFEVIGEPRRGPGGVIVGLTAAAVDVTDIKRGEFKRLELERRLASSQRLESLGLLAGGVAHDFNNLLVGVTGNASLLEAEIPPGSRGASLLAGIQTAANMAAELTRSLLDYTGRGQHNAVTIDLVDPAQAAINALRPRLTPSVTIRLQPTSPAPASADPTQIRQVALNLIQNAVDACAATGSGNVTVRTTTATLTLGDIANAADIRSSASSAKEIEPPDDPTAPAGTFAILEVSDTGPGLDQHTAERIFDPFFTTKSTGRGLGLAIIAGVVRRHQGHIILTTAPGQGTTFTIAIPVAPLAIAKPALQPH